MRHRESNEQQRVAYWLRVAGIFFCAIPNGGKRNRFEAARMKTEGVVAGAPDLLIFDVPSHLTGKIRGVAIEMKAPTKGRLSDKQREFLAALEWRNWATIVANGASDAFAQLTELGFEGLPVPHEVQP